MSHSQTQDHPDVAYLKQDHIGKIIAQGLAVCYKQQPKLPIDFLAKWLLNYSATQKYNDLLLHKDQQREVLIHKYQQLQDFQHQLIVQQEQEREAHLSLDENFRQKVLQSKYHEELLENVLPNFIELYKQLTGTYIGVLDYPKIAINDDIDDEYGHLEVDKPKIIQYIGSSESQEKLMKNNQLPNDTGVTYDVFKEKEEEPAQDTQEGVEDEVPKVKDPNYVYVPDVVRETRIHYFRLPKLGAYLAIPLIIESCLTEDLFDQGLAKRIEIIQEKKQQLEAKEQREQEYKLKLEEMRENGEDTTEFIQEYESQQWPEIVEPAFQSIKKEYVVGCDTLDQDRQISEDDRRYLIDLVIWFKRVWETSEQKQLSHDIDLQLKYQEQYNVSELIQHFQEEEEDALQHEASRDHDDHEESEEKINYEKECSRLAVVKQQLITHKDILINLKNYTVIKFSGIIQTALYLIGYTKDEINIPGTNLLNWKITKSLITEDKFFKKINEYNHRGPKTKVHKFALVNRLQKRLEKYQLDSVESYNLGLGRLLRYLQLVTDLRIKDIKLRRNHQQRLIAEREDLTAKKKEQDKAREVALKEAKEQAQAAEEEFNEQEWEETWQEENPPIDIPDEVVLDFDDDLEKEDN